MKTTTTATRTGAPLFLTARAVDAVKKAMTAQKLEGHTLRIGLVPGGCSGFSYDMDMVRETRGGDFTFEQDGIAIAVDAASVPMLHGTEVDYVDDGMRAGFAFKNPNARQTCGCGSSFQG